MRPRRFAQCRVAEVTGKDAKDVGPARTGSLCVAEGWGPGGAVKDNDQDVEETIQPLGDLCTNPAHG